MAYIVGSPAGDLREFQEMAPQQPYSVQGQQPIAPYAYNKQITGDLLAGFSSGAKADRQRFLDTYNKMFQQIPSLQESLLGDINQMGESRKGEINQQFTDTTNNALANLYDRGIGGSTFTVNAFQGAEKNRQFALNDLNEQLLQKRVDVKQNLGNTLLGAESQFANKQFADPSVLIGLLQTIGRGGGGLDQAGVSQSLSSNVQGIF